MEEADAGLVAAVFADVLAVRREAACCGLGGENGCGVLICW